MTDFFEGGAVEYGSQISLMMRRDSFDYMAALTGKKGIGKSTLAQWIGKGVCSDFDIHKHIVFSSTLDLMITRLKQKIKDLPRYSSIIVDEAVNTAYKQDWYDRLVVGLSKHLNTTRKDYKAILFCLPHLTSLTKTVRDDLIDVWIHVIQRGEGLIFMKNPFNPKDRWGLDEIYKLSKTRLTRKRLANLSLNDYVSIYAKSPNFVGTVKFDKLPDEEFDQYLELDRASKAEAAKTEEFNETDLKDFYRNALSGSVALNFELLGLEKPKGGFSRWAAEKISAYMPDNQRISKSFVWKCLNQAKKQKIHIDEPPEGM